MTFAMPRKKSKYTPRRKDYKRRYTVNKGKLMDKKINTILERRIAQIAADEVNKARIKLIHRMEWGGEYIGTTNTYVPNSANPALGYVGWTGHVAYLSQIPKVDIEFINNIPAPNNPLSQEDEKNDGDGPGHGMQKITHHGRRISDMIKVTGIALDLRFVMPMINTAITPIPLFGYVDIHYAIVVYQDEKMIESPLVIGADPTSKELLLMPPFGYSSRLDRKDYLTQSSQNCRVLYRGRMRMPVSTSSTQERNKKVYAKFKNPIQITYDPQDQNGDKPLDKKFYFVIRSTCPDGAPAIYKPEWYAKSKVYYYEP